MWPIPTQEWIVRSFPVFLSFYRIVFDWTLILAQNYFFIGNEKVVQNEREIYEYKKSFCPKTI